MGSGSSPSKRTWASASRMTVRRRVCSSGDRVVEWFMARFLSLESAFTKVYHIPLPGSLRPDAHFFQLLADGCLFWRFPLLREARGQLPARLPRSLTEDHQDTLIHDD